MSSASAFLASRRRMIKRRGLPMTLRRLVKPSPIEVALLGFLTQFSEDEIGIGGAQQGDAQLAILDDEIADAGWPGPPRDGDVVVIDGRSWRVIGSNLVEVGELVIGHALWIRGG